MSFASHELKIFSMNMHCGLGDWKSRSDLVIQEIISSQPDVIGLQEICFNSEMNMTEYFLQRLEALGYQIKSWKTLKTHKSFLKFQEELLIISKHEATSSDGRLIPGVKFFENGYAALEINGVWFVTTHLHFALPQIRSAQYKTLSSLFSEKNAVIFGDMNSNPTNRETGIFHEENWTPFYAGPTYPSDKPTKTFDGFWITKSFAQYIKSHEIRRLFVDAQTQPSDHLGIDLSLILEFAQ